MNNGGRKNTVFIPKGVENWFRLPGEVTVSSTSYGVNDEIKISAVPNYLDERLSEFPSKPSVDPDDRVILDVEALLSGAEKNVIEIKGTLAEHDPRLFHGLNYGAHTIKQKSPDGKTSEYQVVKMKPPGALEDTENFYLFVFDLVSKNGFVTNENEPLTEGSDDNSELFRRPRMTSSSIEHGVLSASSLISNSRLNGFKDNNAPMEVFGGTILIICMEEPVMIS